MITSRLNWTITQGAMWLAIYMDGTALVARTKAMLMSEINLYEATL
jgi:hypothetical protein